MSPPRKVGSYYKTPRVPVWVVGSASHFTVLFGVTRASVLETRAERLLAAASRAFKACGPDENGFVAKDKQLGEVERRGRQPSPCAGPRPRRRLAVAGKFKSHSQEAVCVRPSLRRAGAHHFWGAKGARGVGLVRALAPKGEKFGSKTHIISPHAAQRPPWGSNLGAAVVRGLSSLALCASSASSGSSGAVVFSRRRGRRKKVTH